jgi:hypothetical protein
MAGIDITPLQFIECYQTEEMMSIRRSAFHQRLSALSGHA